MKKSDYIFIVFLVITNILAWVSIFYTKKDVEINNITEKKIEDSIKNIIDTTYIFEHSQLK